MGTKKKSIIMFILAIVLIVMGVGYAAVRTTLSINGTANLEATWDVSITGITEGTATGKAYNKSTPSYTGTNATFNVGFKALGDSMDYEITVTNNGTMDAVISDINIYSVVTAKKDISKVSYVTTGIKKGDVIKSTENKKFHIILDYPEYMSTSTEELQLQYILYLNLESYNNQSYAQKYDLNDRVVLDDGSIWRVLKTSNEKDENVTLIKEIGIKNLSSIDPTYSIDSIQNYLNSEYKENLSENIKENLVGNIEIPKFMDWDNQDYKSDSKYLSDFIYGSATRCFDLENHKVKNCNLEWISQVGELLTMPESMRRDNVYFTLSGVYALMDGEKIVDCSEHNMENVVFNSQIPITEEHVNIINISDSSKRELDAFPMSNIIQKDGVNKTGFHQCGVRDLSQINYDFVLHPVITINKDAIK